MLPARAHRAAQPPSTDPAQDVSGQPQRLPPARRGAVEDAQRVVRLAGRWGRRCALGRSLPRRFGQRVVADREWWVARLLSDGRRQAALPARAQHGAGYRAHPADARLVAVLSSRLRRLGLLWSTAHEIATARLPGSKLRGQLSAAQRFSGTFGLCDHIGNELLIDVRRRPVPTFGMRYSIALGNNCLPEILGRDKRSADAFQ